MRFRYSVGSFEDRLYEGTEMVHFHSEIAGFGSKGLHKSHPKHKNANPDRLDSFFKKSMDIVPSLLLGTGAP